jgi:hypothetical protein
MSHNQHILPEDVQRRMRNVAEREALRLARPDRTETRILAHANRQKSAVSSTPFGFSSFKRIHNDDNDWCGPFSVARRMIAEREEARKQREEALASEEPQDKGESHPLDALVQEVELEKKKEAHPSLTWKSKRQLLVQDKSGGKVENLYAKRRRRHEAHKRGVLLHDNEKEGFVRKVPSLFDICVKFIVDNFEHVDSLGLMVDSSIRRAICHQLVASGKMNGASFDTLAEKGIETLDITDCTEVTQEQMVEALEHLVPTGLRALMLVNAGRCFGSKAVDAILRAAKGEDLKLFALSISGAYLLRDLDVSRLISISASSLSSIEFKTCPHLGLEFSNAIGTHFSSNSNTSHLMELSLEDIPITGEHLRLLATSSDALRNLKSVKLKQIDGLNDDNMDLILKATRGNLEGIDLSINVNLTDQVLSSIRKYCSNNLKSLILSDIRNFTNAGLEAFFTFIPGLSPPPSLKTLDLARCGFDTVNENVINLAIEASSLRRGKSDDNPESTNNQGLSVTGGLVFLDVNGSSITDTNLEKLATHCKKSLQELRVNFCPLVSDKGLGYLVSECGHQLKRIEVWGNAQIGDEFLDGHGRIGKFEVEGAWMKDGRGCNR